MSPAKPNVGKWLNNREQVARWLARRLVVDHGQWDTAEEIWGEELPTLLAGSSPRLREVR